MAQQYTADFSTAPTFTDFYSNVWYMTTEVTLGGVVYQVTHGGNDSWKYRTSGGKDNSGAIHYAPYSTMPVTIKRKDGQAFRFYSVWLKYATNSNSLYTPPYLRVSYPGSSLPEETYAANQTMELAKDVIVTSVSLYFSGLNELYLDNLAVGPAGVSTPVVATTTPANLSSTGATLGGNVTSDGGATVTENGIVYSSTNATPTTADTKVAVGTGTGTFSRAVTGLTANTTYYVRAYAINSAGTSYGTVQTFKTLPASALPTHTLSFNGTNQYVAVPNRSALEFTTGTVEMWVKPDWIVGSKSGANPCVISMRSSAGTRYSIHIENNLQGIGIWNNVSYITRPYTFTKGQWYHIAAKMTTSTTEFFVNGVSIGSTANGINSARTGYELKIGASVSEGGAENFLGEIDEVRVWNTARTANEILTNYGNTVSASSAGLVAYYPIEEGVTGPANAIAKKVTDNTSNAFHGTLYNYYSSNANLSALSLSTGTLAPAFAAGTTSYTASVPYTATSVNITPTVAEANATVKVNGSNAVSGSAHNVSLNVGANAIPVLVTAQDGTQKTYTVTITRAALGNVLYLTNSITGASALAYDSYLKSMDYGVKLVNITALTTTDLANVDVVVIGNEVSTGLDATKAQMLKNSNKPLIGISSGAMRYGSVLGGYYTKTGGTASFNGTSANKERSSTIFNEPYQISDNSLQIIQNADYVAMYYMGYRDDSQHANTVSWLNNGSYSALFRERRELFFWAFAQTPDNWTDTGKKLFVNVVEYARAGTKENHIMSFPALPTKQVSDPAFTLSASATSRVTLTYSSSSTAVATISGNTVTINGEGTATITALAPATEVYKETTTTQVLQVVKSSNANLSALALSAGTLTPAFSSATTTYTVTVPYSASSINITPTVADATATITVDGAAAASGNAVAVTLSAGGTKTVSIVVTAQNGTTKTYTINVTRPYPPVSASISAQTNVSCNGGSNGSATVAPAGGTSPYTYSWSPSGGFGATASGLAAGAYTVTVTDANGQTATANITITQPAALATTGAQSNVSCFGGSNAAAAVTVTGGTAPYTYAWAPYGGTAATATGLAAGSYTVTVTDANGCTTTRSFTITQPAAISATVSATNVTTAGGNNGSATVTATGGVAPYTYNWSPRGGTGATANNLSAGNYTVTVRDAYGCTATKAVTILEPTITNVLSISRPGASPTNAATVNYNITFDQPVTGLSVNNFELSTTGVSGASIAGVTSVNSTTYTVAVSTGSGSGEIGLNLANDAGLSLEVVNVPFTGTEKYTIDKDNPVITGVANNSFYNTSVTISFNEGTAKLNGNAFTSGTEVSAEGTYTLVVTDAATNATTVNFTIDKTNPVVTGVADNGKYNTDRSISFNEGTATLNGVAFANGTVVSEEDEYTLVVTDAATNTTTIAFAIDKTNPTGTLAINNGAGFTNTLAVTLQITAADAGGTGVTEMRFFNSNGTPSAWEPVAATKAWTLSSGEGIKTVYAEVKDDAGNVVLLNAPIVYDATRPTVVVSSAVPAATNAAFSVTFTFSEGVNEFTLEDITVENGAASAFTKISHEVYTATITPTAEGAVKVSVAADKAVDPALNGNFASNEITTIYDVTRPSVELYSKSETHVNAPFTVAFTFSEAVADFTLADITVTNGTATLFENANGQVYTALITPLADGEVTVSVAVDVAQDAATNGNVASVVLERTYDATKPTVTLATTAANPTNAPFVVTFSFSEEVFGFDVADITVTNGAASDFTKVDGLTYTALVTPAADGNVTVALAAGVVADEATNTNEASAELRRLYDATAPTGYAVAFNTNRVDVTNVSNITLNITGAETATTYFYTIASNNGGAAVTGTAQVQQGSFNLSSLDLTGLNDGTLTAALYLVDAAGNRGANATAEVIKITRDIVAVTTPALIKVPIRTTYANVPMPAKVEVTYSTGAKEQLNVTWSQGNYNGMVAGAYELTGEFILAPMTTNITNKVAKVTVEVQPNKVPTALAFSTTTFKPEATAADVIGSFTTTDPDDNEFSYTLVSGDGSKDNDLFELRGDKLFLKSNKGLSGITQLSIRVRSTDPYNNTIEKSFTLSKELYAKAEDQLKIVNAFSPDGDGINDTWIIPELRFYNNVEIEVFDRSGVRLFHTTNPEKGWDGRDTNGQIRKGAFFYIVQVKDINMVKKGVVTILKK